MTGKWKAAWAAALVIALLTGCGDSDPEPSDREQVEAVMNRFIDAAAAGDGEKACGYLTARAQEDLAKIAGGTPCEQAITRDGAVFDDTTRETLQATRVERVSIDGTRARASFAGGGTLTLEKTGEAWKVIEGPYGGGFANVKQARCVFSGLKNFDGGDDAYWQAEGREDFQDYVVELCRRADAAKVLERPFQRRQFNQLSSDVIREMAARGKIRDPG